MKNKIDKKVLPALTFILLSGISTNAISADAEFNLKLAEPNKYDCTIDELELYVMKRSENLRKDTTLTTWQDFKTIKKNAQLSGSTSSAAKGSSASGNADAEALAKIKAADLAKTGSTTGQKDEEECNLFFSDMMDIEMPESSDTDYAEMLKGGLSALKELAKEQVKLLAQSLTNVIKAGFCERMSTEYLTDLGTDYLDGVLKENYGYTTDDINDGNFANKVINDQLVEQNGDSNAKMFNIMDPELNKKRERYMEKMLDNKLDSMEDELLE